MTERTCRPIFMFNTREVKRKHSTTPDYNDYVPESMDQSSLRPGGVLVDNDVPVPTEADIASLLFS